MKTLFKKLWNFFKNRIIILVSTENFPNMPENSFKLIKEKVRIDGEKYVFICVYIYL